MLKKRDGRLRRVQISETDILDWFTGAVTNWQNVNYLMLPMMKDLPEDASVEYVIHHEPMSRCFSFVIHSKAFSPVPEGAEIPHLESGPHWEYGTVGINHRPPFQDNRCVCNGGSLACDDPRVDDDDLAKIMLVDDNPTGVADAMLKFFKGS